MSIAKQRLGIVLVPFIALASVSAAQAEQQQNSPQIPGMDKPMTGNNLYRMNCAACHGPAGSGASESQVGFEQPLPDFTDCNFAPREANFDWIAVTQNGGPARAFSKLMPAFGDALATEHTENTLDYIRTFCGDKDWPRGELNLPRPLFTTKAFPEDEIVVSSTVDPEGLQGVGIDCIYEKRFGSRNQAEVIVPLLWKETQSENDGQDWKSSVGDIGLALKRVLFHSIEAGSIVSLGGEIFLPTADDDEGFGNGTTLFEPYIAYGQILPADLFLHGQAGAGLPLDTDRANEEIFGRLAVGRTFCEGRYGRAWSPMVELLGSRELVSGADEKWDIVPQFQVTLSRRQHVRLATGVKLPLDNADSRDTVYMVYLLWDWFDGGFFEGW